MNVASGIRKEPPGAGESSQRSLCDGERLGTSRVGAQPDWPGGDGFVEL